jgi:hypothetical protein
MIQTGRVTFETMVWVNDAIDLLAMNIYCRSTNSLPFSSIIEVDHCRSGLLAGNEPETCADKNNKMSFHRAPPA